ncbi:hypothetical protein [Peterkaempfera griseoplana]|uniref:hypothetical protein n=1 Tax=Peterkaempfera griseoplana TaxID=66896 RepID=UPI0006E18A14|nr:hypothetical protein [Peterkaempfera griseoplana]
MAADTPTPLASAADMQAGQYADLVRTYSPEALDTLMIEATRDCEDACDRRLAPFTGLPESHRAQGVDPDELPGDAGIPVSIQATISQSYADAMGGAGGMVRHVWLNQYATRYPDMWAYANLQVSLILTQGGVQSVGPAQVVGAEPDSGHVWFQLGTYLPPGSLIRVTYDGGYQTVPASLGRACKLMAASIAATELNPMGEGDHDPAKLRKQALDALANYQRT